MFIDLEKDYFENMFKKWVDTLPVIVEENKMRLGNIGIPLYQTGPMITPTEAWIVYGDNIVKVVNIEDKK